MTKATNSMFTKHSRDNANPGENRDGQITEDLGFAPSPDQVSDPPVINTGNNLCCAKIVRTERLDNIHNKYYVKTTTGGELYDPWNDSDNNRTERISRGNGRSPYRFWEINKIGFDHYMEFLRNRKQQYYIHAKRELLDSPMK